MTAKDIPVLVFLCLMLNLIDTVMSALHWRLDYASAALAYIILYEHKLEKK